MANEPDTTPIHNLYAQRFAADLETNRKEQEVVSAQIAELELRLKQLKEDENWLRGIQGTLPEAAADSTAAPAPSRAEDTVAVPPASAPASAESAGAGTGSVPKPRQARKATGAATGGTARAKKAATRAKGASGGPSARVTTKTPTARKPSTAAARKTAKPAVGKAAEPAVSKAPAPAVGKTPEQPLRELVLALLVSAGEPRMVNEVATELAQAHPARSASTQVVRNTLETLVKKGSVEKEHRQGSVMYTVAPAAAAEPADAATPQSVPVSDTTEEKVSADV
ncbi:hypothetical protein [Streptomyces sp. NPDC048349]|uniref:hypothetical protein n=1 Tax=Streptomyces sp. NPDC048349 TaxID=3155486 RepID=UPI0034202E08